VEGRNIDGFHNAIYGPPREVISMVLTSFIESYKTNEKFFFLFFIKKKNE